MKSFMKVNIGKCIFLMSIFLFLIFFSLSINEAYAENEVPIESKVIEKTYEKQAQAVVYITVRDEEDPSQRIQGSGFIINPSGVILTVDHLLEDCFSGAEIKLSNGDTYNNDRIEIIDIDHKRDIAVIKIKALNLPVVRLGDSDKVRTGEQVFTIGNPEGLESSISKGIISARRRSVQGRELGYECFQITTPISLGSSGSPVFNMDGEVIGIVTSLFEEGQNLNFAVPINYAKPMILTIPKWSFKEYIEKRLAEIIADIIKQIEIGKTYVGEPTYDEAKYNPDMAIEIFKKIVEERPWFDIAHYWLGYAHYCKTFVSLYESIAEYNKAIELKPNNYDVYFNLSNSYETLGKIEEAIAQLEKGIEVAKKKSDSTEDAKEKKTIKEFISDSEANIERLKKILAVQPKE